MLKRHLFLGIFLVAGLGCSSTESPKDSPDGGDGGTPSAAGEKYLLKEEPAAPRALAEVIEKAEDGESVVLVGRIGGSGKPFTGQASFTVVDLELEPCLECEDPWCELDPKEFKGKTTLVKFVGADGKTLKEDAQTLFGLKPLQVVVVTGKVKKDETGGHAVLADRMFVRR